MHPGHILVGVWFGYLLVVVPCHVVHCASNFRQTAVLFRASPGIQGPCAEFAFLHQSEKDWN
jgi:hypothetical protein